MKLTPKKKLLQNRYIGKIEITQPNHGFELDQFILM